MTKRRRVGRWPCAAVLALGLAVAGEVISQNYPARPIRLLVGFATGGGTDTTARTVARGLPEHLGQPVVVENRPGAGGSLATERAAAAPADGYTLLMMAASDAAQPALRSRLPYDLERDFAPVSTIASGTYVLVVHPLVPARNAGELLSLARAHPGKLNYGSSGIGGASHFAGELFKLMGKVNIEQISYKGGTDPVVAVAAGQIDITFPSIVTALGLLEAKKVKALAVTSARRSSLMPSLPTLNESGLPGYNRSSWYGVMAPAGVSREIVARLNAAIEKTVGSPEIKAALAKQGLDSQTSSPSELASFIRAEIDQNVKLVKLTGVKVDQ